MAENIETISISEFKATCLKLIDMVKKTGRKILITKNGEPAAMVVSPPKIADTKKKYCGIAKDKMKISGDIISPLKSDWEALK